MAHIWIQSDAGDWQTVTLDANCCRLTMAGPSRLGAADPSPLDAASTVLIRRVPGPKADVWTLLAGAAARPLVNGLPAPHGIVVLSDRDEIRWPVRPGMDVPLATPLYFSTERLAAVVPYPAEGRRGSCPRCKQPLTAGEDAVRCPGCGLWHHATAVLPCWTHVGCCAVCEQPTALDAGFRWTPEEL